HGSGQEIIAHFDSKPHKVYQTRVVKDAQGVRVALWQGDAGYESSDADVEGERHRLVLAETGFAFENTAEIY
ncbi:hypothetical protein N9P94_03020, partial [Pseudomonadales bacterium]|nr:hypothetical protein [Pseudomonadales bacterium]